MQANEFLTRDICGYCYICGTEEGFLTPEEAAVTIAAPREIEYFYGAKLERLERDARGRVVLYSACYWTGGERSFIELRAAYRA